MWLFSELSKSASNSAAGQLYGTAVAQARARDFYASLGVDDTPDGRLAVISLHILLILERVSGPAGLKNAAGPAKDGEGAAGQARGGAQAGDLALARAVMEAFVEDLDQAMRELGIGDMGVGKRVKKAMAQFYDYARRYRAARANDEDQATLHVLLVDMIPGLSANSEETKMVQSYVNATQLALAQCTAADLAAGRIAFPNIISGQSRDAHGRTRA